jgi:hypothetical protein
MGFLDELKDKAEEFGDTVKEGLGGGRDKSENVIENVKDRFDRDNTLAEEAGDAANSAADAASDAPEGIKEASPTPPTLLDQPLAMRLRPHRTPPTA